ncbi:MAG: protein-(glutamine-N5) methyltransferase, ribosomal protein L3-specific [Verrucomicrobia bacterium]|nr:protein-(glutamine-N5) methyltransferase, ribosomal protein L3-specific [Verrucomicrobiota bacterium]
MSRLSLTRGKNNSRADSAACVTLGDWLAFAERLYVERAVALGQVASSAHDEALYLLLRTLGLPLDSPARVLTRKISPKERPAIEAMLHRRTVDRVPAAYLTHEAWLGEHRFYVDERAIIPRSYFLEIIPELGNSKGVRRVADVCTGSGCLAILLAHHFPAAKVDALDLSKDALEVAKINVREHKLGSRVTLYRSDVFDSAPPANYDIILSNPPYEPSAHVDAQSPEFKAEPRMAHDGGRDGLVIIRKLLRQARTRLAPKGRVLIEVGGLKAAMNREFAALKPKWLPTQDESDCVCLLEAGNLP